MISSRIRRLGLRHRLTTMDGGNADIAGRNISVFPTLFTELQLPSASTF